MTCVVESGCNVLGFAPVSSAVIPGCTLKSGYRGLSLSAGLFGVYFGPTKSRRVDFAGRLQCRSPRRDNWTIRFRRNRRLESATAYTRHRLPPASDRCRGNDIEFHDARPD
ncbi:hypothetical protein KM043_002096 [Ampulex compressa]|nr:hypothetical protein KM043_002096 [Ampulex compressa]